MFTMQPPADLTAWVTSLAPWIAFGLLGAKQVYDQIKKGRLAQSSERTQEISDAVAAAKGRADEATATAHLRAERISELERELAEEKKERVELERQIERYEDRLRERTEIETRLSRDLFTLQGNYDALERRLIVIESKTK